MIIDVPDELIGEQRKTEILLQFIRYAMEKNNYHRGNTAKFMGISVRGLRKIFDRYPILKQEFDGLNKYTVARIKHHGIEKFKKHKELLRRYPNK